MGCVTSKTANKPPEAAAAAASTNTVPVSKLKPPAAAAAVDSTPVPVVVSHPNHPTTTTTTTTTETTPTPPVKVPRPKDSDPKLSKAFQMEILPNFSSHYTLQHQLGKGNYSVVHQATHKQNPDQVVAVKIVDKNGLDESDVRDILEEVSILHDLREHAHIIRLFGLFESLSHFYIVTEIMCGGELFDEIVQREFYWERDAQEVVKMLADALSYMHERGLVHRDLKPENVLLTNKGPNGQVKLADFGFAARTDCSVKQEAYYPLTTACGTPGYVAPEIVSGHKYGKEVDMWSLGVIAFILLGGYPPFHDEDQQEMFRMIRRGKYSFDPTFWSLVSDNAKTCVRDLLCVDRTKRLRAKDVESHVWMEPLLNTNQQQQQQQQEGEDVLTMLTTTNCGVGGRGQGLEGRGTGVSVNLTPALKELKKFQARRRWKDGMALALLKEGQLFGEDSQHSHHPQQQVKHNMEDISLLSGLGTSAVLTRLQSEKRQRNALNVGMLPA